MEYRQEIDGLRALAVLPVILFHAGLESFQGGFVGVDIFFVISGYLITSIILKEKSQDQFTLLGFYERRARRILPALFFVMFCCIPFAWVWMLPSDLKDFSLGIVTVTTFISNILFWQQSGYFATDSDLVPILHTWSLAIEEQFYLFFPILLLLIWKLGQRAIFSLFITLIVLSLALAQWASLNAPSANFYLIPTRGWELLLGVVAAFYLFNKSSEIKLSLWIKNLLSSIGFLLIIYSIFIFNSSIPFPSLYTLFPTVGTILIILFASKETFLGLSFCN